MSKENIPEKKVILLNGFPQDEIFRIIRVVKALYESPGDIAFAMTTPKSLERTLKDVVTDVAEEHEFMRSNPPGK